MFAPMVVLLAQQISGGEASSVAVGGTAIVAVYIVGAVCTVITAGIVCGGVVATGGGVEAVDVTATVGGVAKACGRITIQHNY